MRMKGWISHLLAILGINAVPAAGWFLSDWSAGTTLLVYWFENLIAALFIAALMSLHRARRNCSGYHKYRPAGTPGAARHGTFLAYFLPASLIFTLAHGFFLLVILFMLNVNGRGDIASINPRSVLTGCAFVVLFVTADFLLNLRGLSSRTFAWMERLASRNLGRVVVVHLALIGGMFAAAVLKNERGFFGVFIALKALSDLSALLPQWNPEHPPRWLCKIMDKIPNTGKAKGQSFAEFWVADKAGERERIAANERLVEK